MRLGFLFVVTVSLLGIGCASKTAATDAHAAATTTQSQATASKATSSKTATSTGKVTCMRKKDHRMLEVQPNKKGCNLAYTKFGKQKVVASSSHDTNYCQKVMTKIKGKLEAAKFTCE